MRKIFKVEKVFIHNENMEITAVQTRIKLYEKSVVSYQKSNKLNPL